MRAPRQDDWMTGIEPRPRTESLMFGLSVVYLVVLLILLITYLG